MMMPSIRFCLVVPVLILALVSLATADELVTLNGKKITGKLESHNEGVITLGTSKGPVRVAVKEIQAIDLTGKPWNDKSTKHDEIELIDGSIIRASSFKIANKLVEPSFLPGSTPPPEVEIPLNTIFAILRNAHDESLRADWRKLLAGRGKRDLLVIKGFDGFNSVPGTVLSGDETGESIRFERESDSQVVNYKLSRATGGLIFNQPPRGVIPPTLCRILDSSGNVWTTETFVIANGGLALKTVAGATVRYMSLSSIVKLDFSQGNVMYLSDIQPRVDAPPPVPGEPYFTYLRDKTDENVPMKLDGVTYPRGVWIFPDTTLTYAIQGDYREFKAIVGVDDSVQVASSAVKLSIEADGRTIFSQVISRKDKPRNLTLDVKGIQSLTLRVEPIGRYFGNQINIAEARVQK